MKEIKDYLHLYFGAEFKITWKNNIRRPHRYKPTYISSSNLARILKCISDTKYYSFQIFLRPLSDMTEVEKYELHLLEDQMEDEDSHVSQLEIYNAMGNKCRKWGIDIDGLIESGLAIVLKSTTCRNCGISKPVPVSEDVEDEMNAWFAMAYGALDELVILKDAKDSGDISLYTEDRKKKAWHSARQVIKLWQESDYGAMTSDEAALELNKIKYP